MNVPGGTQTIKIQAIQTNPITGVKQIVAIPIQAASGANRVPGSSPVKIIKLPGPVVGDGTKVISDGNLQRSPKQHFPRQDVSGN